MRALLACGITLLALVGPARPGGAAEQRSRFDHLTTGFELLGRHRDLPCEACHVNAVFKGTPRDCVACHGAGTAVRATSKPSSHILTTDRCGACHTPVAWVPAVDFDHTQTLGSCSSCHNNVQAQGKDAQHIATRLECNACHDTLGWAGAAFKHAGITGGCASCHDGVSAPGMPANHIPTAGAPCEDCHSTTEFTTFDGAMMDHAAVASMPCSTCHEAGRSFAGTPAVETRPPPPHPATGECSTCHATSNWNATDLPANHIPLPAADAGNCSLCHANPGDYSVYAMNHVNIASNCAQCHGSGMAFANMAPPTLKEPPSGPPPHVPMGTLACELCHTATNFASFAGTVMRHAAVTGQACDSCHELGMAWYGEPNLWVRPDANHHAGQDCGNSGCHRPQDKLMLRPPAAAPAPAARSPTAPATSATPAPRPALRPAVAQAAARSAALRTALAGVPAMRTRAAAAGLPARGQSQQVDHSQLAGACISCHDGRLATGLPAGHPATSTRCDSCHTTNAWLPARFDHLAIAPGSCASCHDGIHAMGKPRSHVATVQSCDACHGTLGWRPVRVDHSAFIAGCAGCHNNVSATGLTLTHFRTQRDCSECHRYPDWSVITFRHASASNAGARSADLACTVCHGSNTDQVTSSNPASGANPAAGAIRRNAAGSRPAVPQRQGTHAPF